jgi:hypothetical protein
MSRRNPFLSSSESEELAGNPFEAAASSKFRNPFDEDDDGSNSPTTETVDDPFGLGSPQVKSSTPPPANKPGQT